MELFTMHFRSFYELDTHHGIKFWKLNSLLLCQVNGTIPSVATYLSDII